MYNKQRTVKRRRTSRRKLLKSRRHRGGSPYASQINKLNQLYNDTLHKIEQQLLQKGPCTPDQLTTVDALIKKCIQASNAINIDDKDKVLLNSHMKFKTSNENLPTNIKLLVKTLRQNLDIQTTDVYKDFLIKCDWEVSDPIQFIIKEYAKLEKSLEEFNPTKGNASQRQCTSLNKQVHEFNELCNSYLQEEFGLTTQEKQIIESFQVNPTYHELTDKLNQCRFND